MKLLRLKLNGYKRFKEPTELLVRGKLTAIVGPNEAGKTSILHALEHLSSPDKFNDKPGLQELSRNVSIEPDQEVIAGEFELSDKERAELVEEFDGHEVARFWISKFADGTRRARLAENSQVTTEELGVEHRAWLLEYFKALEEPHSSFAAEAVATLNEPPPDYRWARRLKQKWDKIDSASTDVEVGERLGHLSDMLTSADTFERSMEAALLHRVPTFRLFKDGDRELRSTYTVVQKTTVFPDATDALRNVLLAAGADPDELAQAVQKSDEGTKTYWEERAQTTLTQLLRRSWPDPRIRVRLSVSGPTLTILVGPEGDYTPILERSDGMRIFAALAAFAAAGGEQRPQILLIDEAERHLHYDAQSQLIQMLGRQTAVSQVIYTTHSAGCLPEDLGTSVRAVQPEEDRLASRAINNVWGKGGLGFTPLHLAMGASTFAFGAVRRAVFVEGITDCALYPTLFKEATGRDQLGLQFVPGLSRYQNSELADLADEASQAIGLVDGDRGGSDLEVVLREHGVTPLRLPEGRVLEDLIVLKTYWTAVRKVGAWSNVGASPPRELRQSNRPVRLKEWCNRQGLTVPSKGAVTSELVSMSLAGVRLLAKANVEPLKGLYSDMLALLDNSRDSTKASVAAAPDALAPES